MVTLASRLFWTLFTAWHTRRDRRVPHLAPERLQRVQDRRVRAMIRHAYATVPHYRDTMDALGLSPRDFRTVPDLAKLPIVDGRQLAEQPERFLSSAVSPDAALVLDTTGTTGRYKRIHHDTKAVFLARAAGRRRREVLARYVGRTFGYRDLYVGPCGGTRDQVLDFYTRRSWVPSSLDVDRSLTSPAEPFAAGFAAIQRMRPDVISGFGAYIGALYRRAYIKGVDLHRPRVITYGGDRMQPEDRRLIEDELGIPVVSSYQSCECLNIAFQCRSGGGFHISVDQVAVRVVDEDGRTLPPGETGEVVVSNLINRATVLLNYRIGDLAALSAEPCPCGRNLPLLKRLEGRAEDPILRSDGETVHESIILPRLYAVPGVVLVQLLHHGPARLTLRVVRTPDARRADVDAGLRSAVADVVGADAGRALRVEHVPHIPFGPGGKFRAIIAETG